MADVTTDQDIADVVLALKQAEEMLTRAEYASSDAAQCKREAMNAVVSKFMHLIRSMDIDSRRAVFAAVKHEMTK